MDQCPFRYNTKEYHAWHSRKWFKNLTADEKIERNRIRTLKRNEKKQKWVEKFLNKCHDCLAIYPAAVFEFHHLDASTKDRDPAQLFMLSDTRIEDELNKCVMLCANCHRIRHNGTKDIGV